MSEYSKIIITTLAFVLFAGCRQKAEKTYRPDKTEQVQPERHGRIKLTVGQSVLWVEVVDNPRSREQGLMFRKSMPEDEGMLFIFEYPQMQSFWMKNTFLPLDIAFISDQGVIINILTMKPLDEGPRYHSLAPALYVIEANAGWFGQNGVKAGDKVIF
ncbi:MAG: DUF192 domain-containing protein [Candidatus Edwardsbacteria bacterium]|nr:DUF192 domain-containing protein [Candidatus Edwardsbacteria bacterium]MBU1577214.1 DUF192 domain-containing protein [Candidatus Edwardsbacteria bacterium]MBU2462562.1 DUF192 domain-containing protein [Candidatus Edwardsbacteria bacterium]MBU2594115.1 DUF192 domain-containing protein [Candidatus Edwardsbacteria bacterium]